MARSSSPTAFPEIVAAATALPDGTVLDGEVLAFRDGRPLPFSALQQRIGRQKQVARKARDVPVVFMTFDVLEHDGRDIRLEPLCAPASKRWLHRPHACRQSASVRTRARRSHATHFCPSRTSQTASRPMRHRDPAGLFAIAVRDWEELSRLRRDSRLHGVEGLMLKRLDSPTASAASAATGGSGRSTPSRWTRC